MTTFVEQVVGLTTKHGCRSIGLSQVLRRIALALGGRAGARPTAYVATEVNRMTLLLAGSTGGHAEDFALRRGHV